MKYRILAALLCACLLLSLAAPLGVRAAEEPAPEAASQPEAQLLSTKNAITAHEGFPDIRVIYDDNLLDHVSTKKTASLTLENSQGIGYLYFIYQYPYQDCKGYTVTDNTSGKTVTAGLNGFLHEAIDLKALFGTVPTSVTVRYDQGKAHICELMLYSEGKLPDTVQQWKPPAEGKTDLLLFSTHGDDEQLFFAGILPYYAKALGLNVQVVYLTDHRNGTTKRVHEMLNGIWAVGCDTYPVFGKYADFLEETGSWEGNKKATYKRFQSEYGVTKDDILAYCTENIRRFQPKVIVTHDFKGEYKHGQHCVYAECVAEALELAPDATKMPQSAEKYGTWDTPKAYFHLYEENKIVMDWDTPMEALDGMTPFEVTQKLGFPSHKSQQWTWFKGWINGKNGNVITRADQIQTHSPCQFGLYRTTVGPDVQKNDFMENVTTYQQDYELWLEQNPPVVEPPETDPVPTTPSQDAKPTEPNQTPQPKDTTRQKDDHIALMFWIGGLFLLLSVFCFLLALRFRKPKSRRRRRRA